jgi:hypothetical protein
VNDASNVVDLKAIPDRKKPAKRKYTKRAAKWGMARKAASPLAKLAFSIDGQRLEVDLPTARKLYDVLHSVFGGDK